ncbi:hypothetical protein [Micromonospora chokoriensis]|uniref:hypothetical protein n=1 Tax=Micromonospora chokoriensis TaxID=356851 RepID=UPI0012F960DD|nr:hypothetical protein [Micromonospora chokoriensis]
MRTLPSLPVCGEPATVRIELCTSGSLDACAYACATHAPDVTAEVLTAGLSANPGGMAAGVERPCGYVHVFPTGNLANPPHPAWCDRDDCQRRGQHRSQASHLDTNRPESLKVDACLVQALHPAAEPMVNLTSVEGNAAACLVLSVRQTRVLRYRLANLLDAAKPARNNAGRWQ